MKIDIAFIDFLVLVVNPCYSNPCRFGGQCIDVTSGYNWLFKHMQYYCLCKPPHMGPHCTGKLLLFF